MVREWNRLLVTTSEESLALVEHALTAEPLLCHFGIGMYGPRIGGTDFDRTYEAIAHLARRGAGAEWIELRIDMLNNRSAQPLIKGVPVDVELVALDKALIDGVDAVPRDRAFQREREHLREALDQVAASADWLAQQKVTKTVRRKNASYGYKHRVEEWFAARRAPQYVSNGSFIAAAVGRGLTYRRCDPDSPNVYFNISFGGVKRFSRMVQNMGGPRRIE